MIFNWEYYLLKNIDLNNNNLKTEDEVLNHFNNFGIFEQRLYCDISIFFNWQSYLKINLDLNNINNELDAWKHFLYYGKREKRNINYKEILYNYCI
jgi:hypothetical protein